MISRDLSTQILKEVVAELMKRGDHSGAQLGGRSCGAVIATLTRPQAHPMAPAFALFSPPP